MPLPWIRVAIVATALVPPKTVVIDVPGAKSALWFAHDGAKYVKKTSSDCAKKFIRIDAAAMAEEEEASVGYGTGRGATCVIGVRAGSNVWMEP